MTTTDTLFRGSLFRSVDFLLTLVVTLLTTPFIVHSLGDRYYGSWTLIGTFIGYYGLLDFGFSSALTRYVSQALGRHDHHSMNATASTAFVLFGAISVVALLLTAGVVAACPLFISEPREVGLFRQILLLMGVTVAVGFPFRVFSGILASFLRYDALALISIGRVVGANALVYLFLSAGGGIFALVIINCLASLGEYVSSYVIARTNVPTVTVRLRYFERARVRDLLSYSLKSFVIQIADVLRFRVDVFVIAVFLNVSLITYYSLGSRLIDYFGSCLISMVGFTAPLFSQYEARGDSETLRRRFLDLTLLSTTFSVFIGLSIIFYGKQFIQRWMGPGFEGSYYVAVILGVPATIALTQTPGIQLLYGLSKHHYFAISNASEGLLNLVLSIVLVQYYGMYGVALGTALEMIVFKLVVQPWLICRSIDLPLRKYLFDTIGVTGAKVCVPLVIYFLLVARYIRPDYFNLLIISALQTLFLIPVVYLCVLNDELKYRIKSVLRLV